MTTKKMKKIFFSKKTLQTSLRQNVDRLKLILLPCYFNPYPKQIYLNEIITLQNIMIWDTPDEMRPLCFLFSSPTIFYP